MSLKSSEDSMQQSDELKLESLLLYDWFLIEIGKHLISPNDEDLKNILCLNKKINERATIVFKHHFLNFKLQKQIAQLIQQENFIQIQEIFQKNPYSLNPNILFLNGQNQVEKQRPSCIHQINTQSYQFSAIGKCESYCSNWNDDQLHLVMIASRFELDSLVSLILFHPRFDFNLMFAGDVNEVFHWSIVKNNFDIFKFIISKCTQNSLALDPNNKFKKRKFNLRKQIRCILSDLDIRFAVFFSLEFSRLEILDALLNNFAQDVPFEGSFYLSETQEQTILDLSFDRGGSQMMERILKSNLFQFNLLPSIQRILRLPPSLTSKSNEDFLLTLVKYDLGKSSIALNSIPAADVPILMKNVLNRSNEDHENLALSLSFFFGVKDEFENQLKMRKWNDEELLNLLRKSISFNPQFSDNGVSTVTSLLNSLSEKAQITEKDVNESIWFLKANLNCMKLIWNDKRTVRTRSWTCQNFIRALRSGKQNLIDFFKAQVSMSEVMTFQLVKDLEIQTEVRNCSFLSLIQTYPRTMKNWNEFLEKYEVKWNEELFDWSLKVALCSGDTFRGRNFSYFLDLPKERSFWSDEKICNVFKFCIGGGFIVFLEIFPSLIQKFPKANLSHNVNNDCLRLCLATEMNRFNQVFRDSLMNLIPNFHFKNKEEQQEFLDLVGVSSLLRDVLLKIEIKN